MHLAPQAEVTAGTEVTAGMEKANQLVARRDDGGPEPTAEVAPWPAVRRDDGGPVPTAEVAPWPAESRAADVRPKLDPAASAAGRRSFRASLALAITGHAAVLVALLYLLGAVSIGGGGIELEAISVDMVSSAVLESRSRVPASTAAPESGSVQANDGPVEPSDPAELTVDQQTSSATVVEPPRRDWETKAEPPQPDAPALEIATQTRESEKPETREPPDRRPKEDEKAVPAAPAEASRSAGGAASRGQDPLQLAEAAAAASAGRSNAYARSVVETLARARPRASAGERGTVRIAFTIGPGGEVSTAQVKQSSGRPVIDGAALAAVRAARFPAPPAGMTARELSFEIPYFFR